MSVPPQITGSKALPDRTAGEVRIGDEALTVSPMRPGGIILVDGTRASARTRGSWLDTDAEVVIVGGDNHGYIVEPVAEVEDRLSLPGYGTPVVCNFGQATRAEARLKAERFAHWGRQRTQSLNRIGTVFGAGWLLSLVLLLWEPLVAIVTQPVAIGYACGAVIVGGLSGRFAMRGLDRFLISLEFGLHRATIPTATLFGMFVLFFAPPVTIRYGLPWGPPIACAIASLLSTLFPVLGFFLLANMPEDGIEMRPQK